MKNFKIGDWVREDFGDTNVVQIKEKYISNDGNIYINNFNSELFSKWQPKENEWCWFWDKDEIPVLRQSAYSDDTGSYKFKTHNIFQKSISKWNNCEPFIGELPSFLKDK